MKIDLHSHSNHSDGTWSVEELVDYAVSVGLTHIALTDHDTVSGIRQAETAAYGRVEIVPGVEINTISLDHESKIQDVHILGYFIDPDSIELKLALDEQQRLRQEHVIQVLERLNAAGVPLKLEDIKKFSGTGSIGKAHITKALVAIGAASDIMEAYEHYTSKTSPFFVQRKSISPAAAIAGIRAAGGIASLAHSGKRPDIKSLLKTLIADGLEAVEVFHRMHSAEQIQSLIKFAGEYNLLITGGSDCHGPYEDFQPTIGSITCPADAFNNLRQKKNFQFSAFSCG